MRLFHYVDVEIVKNLSHKLTRQEAGSVLHSRKRRSETRRLPPPWSRGGHPTSRRSSPLWPKRRLAERLRSNKVCLRRPMSPLGQSVNIMVELVGEVLGQRSQF